MAYDNHKLMKDATGKDIVDALQEVANAVSGREPGYRPIYGFDMDLTNSDPDGCVAYVGANAGYQRAHMDFANDEWLWGDWQGAFFMPRPCMLSFSGEVKRYLDPDDYTKFSDGTTSDVATSTTANAMMEWPVIWVKRWTSGGLYCFRVSEAEFDGANCYANVNAAGDVVRFYTPIYFGSKDSSNRLRSLSGKSNYVSTTTTDEREKAMANGSGWDIERIVDRWLICDLLTLITKSRDSQTSVGTGRCKSSNTSAIGQGTMDAKGLFWGSNDEEVGVKVFGMENFWGNLWRRQVGWVLVSGTQKVKLTEGTQDGSTGTGYNETGEGYISVSDATPSGTSGGYVSTNVVEPYGLLPKVASGTATTYSCDGLLFNNEGTRLVCVGGDWGHGALVGAACAYLAFAPSNAGARFGAAPSYK